MKFQERVKRFKRAFARYCLYFTSWMFKRMPYSFVKGMANFFVTIGYTLTIRQKKIAYDSLQIAFGDEKSDQEIRSIVKKCFANLGRGMIELVYLMDHPSLIKENVVIEGMEHLEQAFKKGKGVVAVSAHFGSFPLMLLKFAQEGYKTNAIIRPTRDETIEKYFFKLRSRLGLNTVYSHPRKKCVDTSIRVLRNNELLFIPLDQNFGSGGGVFVDFFGQKAATATGPVVFSKRTGAPVIPMFIVRLDNNTHKVIIEPEIPLESHEDEKEMIQINTAKITKLIERYVRKYPEEWGWMHRRWKSKPPGEE